MYETDFIEILVMSAALLLNLAVQSDPRQRHHPSVDIRAILVLAKTRICHHMQLLHYMIISDKD